MPFAQDAGGGCRGRDRAPGGAEAGAGAPARRPAGETSECRRSRGRAGGRGPGRCGGRAGRVPTDRRTGGGGSPGPGAGAVGLAIVAAALLLWPFAGLSWIPWLVGFLALILLRLLRLDGLLRGWDVHAAGLVVVAGLMISTTPWAWALAASIGVLIAGLTRLPAWRLAALGAVLCLLAGAGYVWSTVERSGRRSPRYAPVQERSRQDQGAPRRATGVLPILLNRIAQGSPDAICDNLLAEPVRAAVRPRRPATRLRRRGARARRARSPTPAGTPTRRRPVDPLARRAGRGRLRAGLGRDAGRARSSAT